ncbi:hypothetical protein HMPREF0969_00086 [Bacteroides sp. D20]|nr:hypothetical protein HMPREF0969_00086 [Bacteroides sp. D20]
MLPLYHTCSVTLCSSVFEVRWKQQKKVEANFASTSVFRADMMLTYCNVTS